MQPKTVTLDDKYTLTAGRIFITGTQALVRLPMMQHQRDRQQGHNTAGYISGYRVLSADEYNATQENKKKHRAYGTLVVELKFGRNRERIITDLKRISKPGRRVYARKDRLPRVLGGMGTAILSTSGGLVTSRTAQERGVGGEVVCFIW